MHFSFERLRQGWHRQGYLIVTGACVLVIIGSAVWTQQRRPGVHPSAPTMPRAETAASLVQESLPAVPFSLPTPTPEPWYAPVPDAETICTFDDQQLFQEPESGIWTVHDCWVYPAKEGTSVFCVHSGTVEGISDEQVTVDHGDGLRSVYTGISVLPSLHTGMLLHGGQALGTTAGARVQFQLLQDGSPINPGTFLP